MQSPLRIALRHELESARSWEEDGDIAASFAHLERAHILSQRFTLAHVGVHLRMLRLGWLRRDAREVLGQIMRSVAALFFSRIWVPLGNTGGANVSALRPMPLPADLRAIIEHE